MEKIKDMEKDIGLEDFSFHSDPVLDKARNLINNAKSSFEQELITAFGGLISIVVVIGEEVAGMEEGRGYMI